MNHNNEILNKAVLIVKEDLAKKKKQIKRNSVNMTTSLDVAMIGVLENHCNDCYALQVLDSRRIGCAARVGQIRKMAMDRKEGFFQNECPFKEVLQEGARVMIEGDRMSFLGADDYFKSINEERNFKPRP